MDQEERAPANVTGVAMEDVRSANDSLVRPFPSSPIDATQEWSYVFSQKNRKNNDSDDSMHGYESSGNSSGIDINNDFERDELASLFSGDSDSQNPVPDATVDSNASNDGICVSNEPIIPQSWGSNQLSASSPVPRGSPMKIGFNALPPLMEEDTERDQSPSTPRSNRFSQAATINRSEGCGKHSSTTTNSDLAHLREKTPNLAELANAFLANNPTDSDPDPGGGHGNAGVDVEVAMDMGGGGGHGLNGTNPSPFNFDDTQLSLPDLTQSQGGEEARGGTSTKTSGFSIDSFINWQPNLPNVSRDPNRTPPVLDNALDLAIPFWSSWAGSSFGGNPGNGSGNGNSGHGHGHSHSHSGTIGGSGSGTGMNNTMAGITWSDGSHQATSQFQNALDLAISSFSPPSTFSAHPSAFSLNPSPFPSTTNASPFSMASGTLNPDVSSFTTPLTTPHSHHRHHHSTHDSAGVSSDSQPHSSDQRLVAQSLENSLDPSKAFESFLAQALQSTNPPPDSSTSTQASPFNGQPGRTSSGANNNASAEAALHHHQSYDSISASNSNHPPASSASTQQREQSEQYANPLDLYASAAFPSAAFDSFSTFGGLPEIHLSSQGLLFNTTSLGGGLSSNAAIGIPHNQSRNQQQNYDPLFGSFPELDLSIGSLTSFGRPPPTGGNGGGGSFDVSSLSDLTSFSRNHAQVASPSTMTASANGMGNAPDPSDDIPVLPPSEEHHHHHQSADPSFQHLVESLSRTPSSHDHTNNDDASATLGLPNFFDSFSSPSPLSMGTPAGAAASRLKGPRRSGRTASMTTVPPRPNIFTFDSDDQVQCGGGPTASSATVPTRHNRSSSLPPPSQFFDPLGPLSGSDLNNPGWQPNGGRSWSRDDTAMAPGIGTEMEALMKSIFEWAPSANGGLGETSSSQTDLSGVGVDGATRDGVEEDNNPLGVDWAALGSADSFGLDPGDGPDYGSSGLPDIPVRVRSPEPQEAEDGYESPASESRVQDANRGQKRKRVIDENEIPMQVPEDDANNLIDTGSSSPIRGPSGGSSSLITPRVYTQPVHRRRGRSPNNPSNPERPFKCEIYGCDKTFKRASDMVRHVKVHNGDKPYICGFENCGKSFVQASGLNIHMRTHTGEKPFLCEYPGCNKAFGDSSSLARHRNVHMGNHKSFLCDYDGCGKGFARASTLARHVKTIHADHPTPPEYDESNPPPPKKRRGRPPKPKPGPASQTEEDNSLGEPSQPIDIESGTQSQPIHVDVDQPVEDTTSTSNDNATPDPEYAVPTVAQMREAMVAAKVIPRRQSASRKKSGATLNSEPLSSNATDDGMRRPPRAAFSQLSASSEHEAEEDSASSSSSTPPFSFDNPMAITALLAAAAISMIAQGRNGDPAAISAIG